MTQSNSSRWDLCRFVKTLSYFGAIPLLSSFEWFQRMFDSRPNPKADRTTIAYSADEAIENGSSSTKMVFDFAQPDAGLRDVWGALDDVVMGGVSQSNIQFVGAAALFAGNVSTANSGGFASVRTRNFEPPLNLAGYDGVLLRVRGDGQRYKFMLRQDTTWDSVAYCYSFDTVAHEWITIRIPFADLIPVFRARTVGDAAPIERDRICAFQLMLSKFEYDGALNPHFQPGAFQLQIQSIQVYQ